MPLPACNSTRARFPESFILLRDIPIVDSNNSIPRLRRLRRRCRWILPVLIIRNDSVLTVGTDILNAFDRLEVAEFQCAIADRSAEIGTLVPIGAAEIQDLERAFHQLGNIP